jgi:hypothetical protein
MGVEPTSTGFTDQRLHLFGFSHHVCTVGLPSLAHSATVQEPRGQHTIRTCDHLGVNEALFH